MTKREPVSDEHFHKLCEAVLIDMGRDMLAILKQHGFDSSDKQVFYLVRQAVDEHDFVALAVIHENRVLIIKHAPDDGDSFVVIPCADANQVARAALEYGDETARNAIQFVSSH